MKSGASITILFVMLAPGAAALPSLRATAKQRATNSTPDQQLRVMNIAGNHSLKQDPPADLETFTGAGLRMNAEEGTDINKSPLSQRKKKTIKHQVKEMVQKQLKKTESGKRVNSGSCDSKCTGLAKSWSWASACKFASCQSCQGCKNASASTIARTAQPEQSASCNNACAPLAQFESWTSTCQFEMCQSCWECKSAQSSSTATTTTTRTTTTTQPGLSGNCSSACSPLAQVESWTSACQFEMCQSCQECTYAAASSTTTTTQPGPSGSCRNACAPLAKGSSWTSACQFEMCQSCQECKYVFASTTTTLACNTVASCREEAMTYKHLLHVSGEKVKKLESERNLYKVRSLDQELKKVESETEAIMYENKLRVLEERVKKLENERDLYMIHALKEKVKRVDCEKNLDKARSVIGDVLRVDS